ncbi:FAD-dependent oxidoreductase [Streptomyces sp. APSN-46.1]|uniref:NAD(P)/FAD-dependent oxidoreductase n=1 Tax=Streptomyces sp. APSN-46.1 TaxID=2929049 RepID=UPI001FB3E5E7|nr:FAD-dependent oxidoreductase [Streptomyces sp. APSN-46.1]MCJ1678325.1 FAD-dependent oxidoreductase [Streptomyces sp. APSN-46.1]
MRVTVVGGGVVALITAVECVLSGHQVAVVDRGPLPARPATAFGQHRIMAALNPADFAGTAAGLRAQHRWGELEELFSARLYERVGALSLMPPPAATEGAALLAEAGGRARALTADGLAGRYPHLNLGGGRGAVLEEGAGVLLTDRVLAAAVGWLRWQPGVELHPYRPVASVDGESGAVRLVNGDVLRGDVALVAAGARSRGLLPPVITEQLTLHRTSLLHCRVPRRQAAAWASTPPVAGLGATGGAWLVPPVAGGALTLGSTTPRHPAGELTGVAAEAGRQRRLESGFGDLLPGFGPDWITRAEHHITLSFAEPGGPGPAALGGAGYAYAVCGSTSLTYAPLIARSLADRLTDAAPSPTGLSALDRP